MESREDVPLQQLSRETSTLGEHEEQNTFPDEFEVPPYEGRDEVLPAYEQRSPEHISSTRLHRNYSILIPVALYATMAIYSWVTISVLSQVEGYTTNNKEIKTRSYKAARILQLVTSVTTLPTISFVCAWAAAVFVQNQRDAYSLRLRQVVSLADRAWMDPMQYVRFLIHPSGFKRYGSSMLFLAIFIHIFGAITYPIQSAFLSTRLVSISPADKYGHINFNTDYVRSLGQIFGPAEDVQENDASYIFTVRQESQTQGVNGYQDNLWGNTSQLDGYSSNSSWFAPISRNTSTGLYSEQYIPRVNCSAEVQNMTANEFPSNCSDDSLFYAYYAYPNGFWNLTVEVCLPGNINQSPWLATDARQDFTEVLYVNVSTDEAQTDEAQVDLGNLFNSFKVTMNTTAGLFELPNMRNGQTPGPLVSNTSCTNGYWCNDDKSHISRRVVDPIDPSALGPLAIVALALFGPGSFADTQQTEPRWAGSNESDWKNFLEEVATRGEMLPLAPLGFQVLLNEYPAEDWFASFANPESGASSAFTQAGFLAIKAIFNNEFGFDNSNGDVEVYSYNETLQEITLPSMSFAALIACSVLFVLYMVPLLCLALYAALSPRWTNTLDAFTMLRMGAALGQKDLPLLIGKSQRKIAALDDLPGVVRDISGPDDKVRQLALGVDGGRPLQPKKRYVAYPGNHEYLVPKIHV